MLFPRPFDRGCRQYRWLSSRPAPGSQAPFPGNPPTIRNPARPGQIPVLAWFRSRFIPFLPTAKPTLPLALKTWAVYFNPWQTSGFTNAAVSAWNSRQLIRLQDNCPSPLRLRCNFLLPWIRFPGRFRAPCLCRSGMKRILLRSASGASAPEQEHSDEADILSGALSLFPASILGDSDVIGSAADRKLEAGGHW